VTDDDGEGGRRAPWRRRQGVGRTGARFPRTAADTGADAAGGVEPSRLPEDLDAGPADPLVGRTGARFDSRARRERRALSAAPLALPPGPSAARTGGPDAADAPGTADAADAPGASEVADPLLGRTGARFASHARRARREAERRAAQDAVVAPQAAPVVRRRRPAAERPDPPEVPELPGVSGFPGVPAPRWRGPDDAPTAPMHLAEPHRPSERIESRVSVRPYVRTRGRTHVRADLRLETLVSVPSPRPPLEDPEHRAISALCDGPRSVAELAALLRLPLGVARILVGDMAEEGTLTVHPTADRRGPGHGPDADVLARVLRGLQRL
jgi:hypothetical protein